MVFFSFGLFFHFYGHLHFWGVFIFLKGSSSFFWMSLFWVPTICHLSYLSRYVDILKLIRLICLLYEDVFIFWFIFSFWLVFLWSRAKFWGCLHFEVRVWHSSAQPSFICIFPCCSRNFDILDLIHLDGLIFGPSSIFFFFHFWDHCHCPHF